MKISKRVALAGPLAPVAFAPALPAHAGVALMASAALGVAGFSHLGYISDNAATLVDDIGKVLAFGDAHARGMQ
jgi:hypothetical protein